MASSASTASGSSTGAGILLAVPSPVRAQARQLALPVAVAVLGAVAVALAVRLNRGPGGRTRGRLGAEVRAALCSRRDGPKVAVASVVVLAGHLAMFLLAARISGSDAPAPVLLPLAVLALLAMSLPLNVAGWGPREGVTAWSFGAAGLGAGDGLAVAVVYGVLSLAASLPGALVLAARRPAGRYARPASPEVAGSEVSSSKYGAKESTRLASSSFPFSAVPREGRPMTPESV
jgi:hypothetical protein